MTRKERIKRVKATMAKLAPEYQRITGLYERACADLHQAEQAFDPGERVRLIEKCRRGCCVEFDEIGTILGRMPNGSYKMQFDGYQREYVWPHRDEQ